MIEAMQPTLSQRLLARIEYDTNGGCWLWSGATTQKGYGQIKGIDRVVYTHRAAYECFVGPIPDGLQIDHLCRVRCCANPDHLEPVTARENTLRGSGIPAVNARKTRCAAGHLLTAENVYPWSSKHRICRECQLGSDRRWRARKKAEGKL